MTPSKHLSETQKRLFRQIVRLAKDLDTLHPVDVFQIENAAVLTDKIRTMTEEDNLPESTDYESMDEVIAREKTKLQRDRTMTALVTSLNSTMDKLGLSKMKRSPKAKPVGAPSKVGKAAPKKDNQSWTDVLEFKPKTPKGNAG